MPTSKTYQKRLSWLNSKGGWEHWNFLARKSYGYDMQRGSNVKRDIFNNWDTDFIAGRFETVPILQEASRKETIRSQFLDSQQVEAIARIRLSIKVIDRDTGAQVVINPSSFDYRTDNEKLIEFSFDIMHPQEQIQTI